MAVFTFWVAVCFTLNYVIGSGFLTLPWAFNVAGIGFASLVLSAVSALSLLTCWKLLEVMARANKLVDTFGVASLKDCNVGYMLAPRDSPSTEYGSTNNSVDVISTELTPMRTAKTLSNNISMTENNVMDSPAERGTPQDAAIILGDRKFEVAELCGIFLGSTARKAYVCCISLYFYGAMWAYSTVFCNAWSGWLPLFGLSSAESYYVYLSIWAVVECTWCLFELDEQIFVQVILAAGRILMLAMMIVSVLACDFTQNDSFDLPSDAPGHTTSGGSFEMWNPSYLYIILPIAFYANIMHHSVPTLVAPVRDKSQAGEIFVVAFLVTYVAYMTLALVVSSYFGAYSNPSSNLDWMNYLGMSPSDAQLSGSSLAPLYARAMSLFIVVFPSLDVASAFPLNGVTLGNNFMASYYASKMHEVENDFKKRAVFRLLASVPPIIAAAVVKDLGPITAYTGLTGVVISLIVPAALSYSSEKTLEDKGVSSRTVYTLEGTTGSFSLWIVALGGVSIAYIAYHLISDGVPAALA